MDVKNSWVNMLVQNRLDEKVTYKAPTHTENGSKSDMHKNVTICYVCELKCKCLHKVKFNNAMIDCDSNEIPEN